MPVYSQSQVGNIKFSATEVANLVKAEIARLREAGELPDAFDLPDMGEGEGDTVNLYSNSMSGRAGDSGKLDENNAGFIDVYYNDLESSDEPAAA